MVHTWKNSIRGTTAQEELHKLRLILRGQRRQPGKGTRRRRLGGRHARYLLAQGCIEALDTWDGALYGKQT